MAGLSQVEVDAYRRDGFVVPAFQLPRERIDHVRSCVDRAIAANSDPDFLATAHLPARPGTGGIEGGEELFKVAIRPDVLDMVEQLLGPDVLLWGANVFVKPARQGKAVQWHQDGHYYPISPMVTCTVWIAIDSSMRDNACLRVIPGSHLAGLIPHMDEHRSGLLQAGVEEEKFDVASARDIELAPGQMSMHDASLIHGSGANTSTRRRAGFAIRYMPASSSFDRHYQSSVRGTALPYERRPIWLVRGSKIHPSTDLRVGHENLTDLDRLVEEGRIAALGRQEPIHSA